MIQVFRPSYGAEELEAVKAVLESGWTGLGGVTGRFEQRFAEFCQLPHCIGLSSCTAALDLSLELLGIGPGDEVLVPAMTFVSAAHSVLRRGATPVFTDVLPRSNNIDPADASARVTSRTRAVIPVHLAGYPVDMDLLAEMLPGIPVIEDCAHGAGTAYKGKPAGSMGLLGCFSFHAVKNIAMGEGGALVTKRADFAEKAKKLRWLGIDRETWDRSQMERSYWWEYRIDMIGMKCHMDDIHAAIGLVQLEKLERANCRRRRIASMYSAAFSDIAEIQLPPEETSDLVSSWHMYRIQAEARDDLNQYLDERGISTGVHYKPLHLYPCYGDQPSLPVAEKAFSRILTLPMYPDLTDGQVKTVTDAVRSFYRGQG